MNICILYVKSLWLREISALGPSEVFMTTAVCFKSVVLDQTPL